VDAPRPTAIRVERDKRRLVIDWSDAIRSSYPWTFLRSVCPSAGEKVAREEANPLAVLGKIPSSDLTDVRPVGNYAINLVWADGHSAGIYSWEYLRRLSDDPTVETSAVV
jgi:DUF971 family protein